MKFSGKRILPIFVLMLSLVAASIAPLWTGPLQVEARAASREPVHGRHGMVASQSRLASEVGVNVMKRGGNAVDAAVAVAMAMAVTYPEAGNLGGGGFMLIRLRDGRTTAIDYREMAPAAAARNMYLDRNGNPLKGENSSTVGYRAPGVPGTVAGLELALKKYGSGKFNWAQLVEPARQFAADGFPLTYLVARSMRNAKDLLERNDESRRLFLNNGNLYNEGDIFRQPELAATLARLQKLGPREFYEGQTARLIAADMQRHQGLMTLGDLRNYAPKERVPLRGTYRGYEIITMPPPSSGGIVLLEMLNILEGYDLRRMGWSSSAQFHVVAEAMRRAFADRSEYMGDPDFVSVPVAGLIDKAYATRLRGTINPEHASASADVRPGLPAGAEPTETTHFTVVDSEGNAASNTYTLNDLYGSGVTAKGTGVVLNDEMDDFAAKPGSPNLFGLVQGERNAIQPRKRPLSSMTPTFVLRQDGSLWFATGARGGPRIISAVLQIILNVVDHDMNIQQAIDTPRIHQQWLPDEVVYEPYGLSADTQRALEARGHKLTTKPSYVASATGIMIEEKTGDKLGADDSRSDGEPVGY